MVKIPKRKYMPEFKEGAAQRVIARQPGKAVALPTFREQGIDAFSIRA